MRSEGEDEETGAVHVASRKRKNPADRPDHNERVIKHRASKACQSCRTRKVRCDVLTNASRCTNCRLDELECVVLASRRGQSKRKHHQPGKNHASHKESAHLSRLTDADEEVRQSRSAEPTTTTLTFDAWNGADDSLGSVPACVTFDDDKDGGSDNIPGQQASVADDAATNLSSATPYVGLLTPDTHSFQPQQGVAESPPLPALITPLSSPIASEDLEYLVRKGALTVPDHDLRIEILRAYLFSVHPFMPILDYRVFVHAVLSNRPDHRIGLLLFQAVMFAGLHSLSPATIHRLGFESAKEARVVFFNRVRLLYEFDVEPDMAANLQSLILMSSWYSQWDARRDTWYWTGQAYDVARKMGLHREPTARFASEKIRHFRKRLWWSLYIRDRMIALGTRRPMRIYDSDCDVSMLTLDDFDLEPFDEFYQGEPLVPGAKENETTALMCIQLAKLSVHVGHVVSSQYTTQAREIPSTVMIVSRRDEHRAEELESCDRELSAWFEESCNTVQPIVVETSAPHSCSDIHWSVLNMTYQTAVNVLHRSQALQPPLQPSEAQAAQSSSRVKAQRSARSLTKLSQSMLRRDQLRFVGLIGVTAIIAAYLSHLRDITSAGADEDDVCDASKFRLHQSLEVLQAFRRIYASADAAFSFLASVSQKAGISVPMQSAVPPTPPIPFGTHVTGMNHVPGMRTAGGEALPSGSSFSAAMPPASSRQQLQQKQQSLLLDRVRDGSTINNSAIFPTVSGMNTAGSNTRVLNTEHSNPHLLDTTFGGFASSDGDWTSLFSGNSDHASGVDKSTGLGTMFLDHDFYIDAFGLTGGHSPGTCLHSHAK